MTGGWSHWAGLLLLGRGSDWIEDSVVGGSVKEFRITGILPNEPFISGRLCKAIYVERHYLRLSVRMQQIDSSRAHLKYSRLQVLFLELAINLKSKDNNGTKEQETLHSINKH
jgi:hypothetical protein